MANPVSVKALEGYKIQVVYSDGIKGEINLTHLKKDPAYQNLFNNMNFDYVFIDETTKDIKWNSGESICKNAVYKQLELKNLMNKLHIDINKI
ncbi:MAG: DUF2442 domain-containing protein [Ignavibacteria bacterium]|jgi:hypothetical protein